MDASGMRHLVLATATVLLLAGCGTTESESSPPTAAPLRPVAAAPSTVRVVAAGDIA